MKSSDCAFVEVEIGGKVREERFRCDCTLIRKVLNYFCFIFYVKEKNKLFSFSSLYSKDKE
jgi:hypothetical protein